MSALPRIFQILMNINFKRNDLQVYIENAQNCYDIEKWGSYKQSFTNWTINSSDLIPLNNCITSDATSYFLKGLISFSQALADISNKKYSWAIVKLYYSIFYLLRCDVLLSNTLMVRCGAFYISDLKINEKFQVFQKGKARGDHQLTIELVKHLINQGKMVDPILGNLIDGVDAYSWYMHNRERINYSQKNFAEPKTDATFSHLVTYFNENKVFELLDFYNSKNYSICFDTDHSVLSIPYKKLIQVFQKGKGIIDFSGENKRKLIFLMDDFANCSIDKSNFKQLARLV